jgi:8-oxo-dGTP pyrophosphatase MutT (NUDIX family)
VARLKGAERLPSSRATSAGGIVLREVDGRHQVMLGRRRRERDGVTWSLPKGTPDRGETREATALREVTEETGLLVRILAPVGDVHYVFVRGGRRIDKTVHYFLMESTGGDLDDHDHEFEAVAWFDLAEADAIMSYPTERAILAKALPIAGITVDGPGVEATEAHGPAPAL